MLVGSCQFHETGVTHTSGDINKPTSDPPQSTSRQFVSSSIQPTNHPSTWANANHATKCTPSINHSTQCFASRCLHWAACRQSVDSSPPLTTIFPPSPTSPPPTTPLHTSRPRALITPQRCCQHSLASGVGTRAASGLHAYID